MTLTFFFLLSALCVLAALMMVFAKNPVHSVIYLILAFFMIAGLYVLLNAQFLAVVHIIVYAGAIMVLFLFVLMLLNLNNESERPTAPYFKLVAAVSAGMLLVTLVAALKGSLLIPAETNPSPSVGLVETLGKALFTEYVVPFEISGILFLAAMVGSVLVGKRDLKM